MKLIFEFKDSESDNDGDQQQRDDTPETETNLPSYQISVQDDEDAFEKMVNIEARF